MKLVSLALGLVLACGMSASTATAAILFSFGPVPTFAPDSGVQSINLFANSSLPGGEIGAVLGADFLLGSGAIFNGPNAGLFGGPGFIGSGNINAGASSFDRDVTPVLFNTGYLNITFQNFAQSITNVPTPIATLLVDTNGLAAGSYSITSSNGFFGADNIADASSSFNISAPVAIPEPGTLLASGLCVAGVWYRQRRARKALAA